MADLIQSQFDCLFDLFLFPNITRAAPNILVAGFFLQFRYGLFDVIDISADDVDSSTMAKILVCDSVANSSCASTDKSYFSFQQTIVENHIQNL